MNKSPHIVFQQIFSSTPGKPEREFGVFPGETFGFKYHLYLNSSSNRTFGGVGKLEQINKLAASKKDTLHMDTDDLSRETYHGILIEAEKLTHDLTLHFGLLSYDCKNETEYIEKAKKLTEEIMEIEDYELGDLFWGNPPAKEKLIFTCNKILENIEKVKSIPIGKRKYDF